MFQTLSKFFPKIASKPTRKWLPLIIVSGAGLVAAHIIYNKPKFFTDFGFFENTVYNDNELALVTLIDGLVTKGKIDAPYLKTLEALVNTKIAGQIIKTNIDHSDQNYIYISYHYKNGLNFSVPIIDDELRAFYVSVESSVRAVTKDTELNGKKIELKISRFNSSEAKHPNAIPVVCIIDCAKKE